MEPPPGVAVSGVTQVLPPSGSAHHSAGGPQSPSGRGLEHLPAGLGPVLKSLVWEARRTGCSGRPSGRFQRDPWRLVSAGAAAFLSRLVSEPIFADRRAARGPPGGFPCVCVDPCGPLASGAAGSRRGALGFSVPGARGPLISGVRPAAFPSPQFSSRVRLPLVARDFQVCFSSIYFSTNDNVHTGSIFRNLFSLLKYIYIFFAFPSLHFVLGGRSESFKFPSDGVSLLQLLAGRVLFLECLLRNIPSLPGRNPGGRRDPLSPQG